MLRNLLVHWKKVTDVRQYKNEKAMLMIKQYLAVAFSVFLFTASAQSPRAKVDFNKEWKFLLDTTSQITDTSFFNAKSVRKLNLPHDWSIEGAFSEKNPAGFNGGALPGGIGWYRKAFALPLTDIGKNIFIDFDGVYRNSEVWINGHSLGVRPNGYISFQYNLTPYLKFGAEQNVIAVKVDNSQQPNSRWYSGSGIFRNVWLEKMNPVHINHWGNVYHNACNKQQRSNS